MKVIYGFGNFKPLNKKPVVALGIFDGLHRGHQRIISELIKEAGNLDTKSLVVTFFPHPQNQDSIYSLPHRLKLLDELGVDLCLVIRFSPAFRKISAQEFLKKMLIKKINPEAVFIGKNFTFGKGAQGNWQTLKGFSKIAGFRLRVFDVLTHLNKPISSSYIRSLIRQARFAQAQRLLARPVTILGRVIHGSHLGAQIGFPTANIDPDHEVLPPAGVYSVKVGFADKILDGICYIGTRPTIGPARRTYVEVHIFDFKRNLYGCQIQIEFIRKLRPQKRFKSLLALAQQIKRDIRVALKGLK